MGTEVTQEPEVQTPAAWPFADKTVPEPTDERAEHVEDLVEERPELCDWDAIVDASFPASDPPPSPIGHIGGPR